MPTVTLESGQTAVLSVNTQMNTYEIVVSTGVQGVSVATADVTSGNLLITLSNSSVIDAGPVVSDTGTILFDGNQITSSNSAQPIEIRSGETNYINFVSNSYVQMQFNPNTSVDAGFANNTTWAYVWTHGFAAENFNENGSVRSGIYMGDWSSNATTIRADSANFTFNSNGAIGFPDGTYQNTASVGGGLTLTDPYTNDANGQIYLSSTYYVEAADEGSADFIDTGLALTRANQYGPFNALHDYQSPQGTLWNSDGFASLVNVNQRKYVKFFASANGKLGINVLNKQFIMWDTINDKYYTIVFTTWQQSGGGNFAYTRQQIDPLTGDAIGELVSFAKTAPGQQDDIDTDISIARASNQGIYNPNLEMGWDNSQPDTPYGTEWNADGWGDLSDIKNRVYGDLINVSGRYGFLTGQELVMHDTINDKYYTFKFSGWMAGGNGGAFSYERKLINTDVYFYRPDGDDNTVVSITDNFAPGISIARGSGGLLYNIETEDGYAWDVSPDGILWNADGWNDLTDITTRQYLPFGSFYKNATGQVILNNDYVIHDTINNEYWTLRFTRWQVGINNGGVQYPGFAYVRRKLSANQQTSGIVYPDGSIQNTAVTHKDLGTLSQKKVDTAVRYLSLQDIGGHLYVANSSSSYIGIPDSSKVPFPIGAAITIINRSGANVTIEKDNDYESGNIYGSGTALSGTYWYIPDSGGGAMSTLIKIADYYDNNSGNRVVDWMLAGPGIDLV